MRRFLFFIVWSLLPISLAAQELEVKVSINHQQVGNTTKTDIFDELQTKITNFMNERQWTGMTFREQERIQANMAITVGSYSDTDNSFKCEMMLTVQRPVYNSTYTTTVYSTRDKDFHFSFLNTDQLEFQGADRIDNNLIALLSYYAYMIIGYDMDSFAPKGGTEYFQTAQDICTQAENLGYTGWKTFGDPKNRYGLLNDYIDGSMESLRDLTYKYYRQGLDQMSENVETGRTAILECIDLLDEARQAKNMSQLPQLFTEYKGDELVNIFKGKGTREEREHIYDILLRIDASRNAKWDELKK